MKQTPFGVTRAVARPASRLWGRALSVLACGLVAAGLSWAQAVQERVLETRQVGPNERIDVLSRLFEDQPAPAAATGLSRVVFYRHPDRSRPEGAIVLSVQDQYHAALVAGGYSALCLQASPQAQLKAREVTAPSASPAPLARVTTANLPLEAGMTHYFSLVQNADAFTLVRVPEAQALAELRGLRQQVHTISRVASARTCPEATASLPASAPAASATR